MKACGQLVPDVSILISPESCQRGMEVCCIPAHESVCLQLSCHLNRWTRYCNRSRQAFKVHRSRSISSRRNDSALLIIARVNVWVCSRAGAVVMLYCDTTMMPLALPLRLLLMYWTLTSVQFSTGMSLRFADLCIAEICNPGGRKRGLGPKSFK